MRATRGYCDVCGLHPTKLLAIQARAVSVHKRHIRCVTVCRRYVLAPSGGYRNNKGTSEYRIKVNSETVLCAPAAALQISDEKVVQGSSGDLKLSRGS